MPFHGQWYPPVDEVLFRNYFPDKKDGFFIECGAADGVTHSCCLFFEEIGWRGINIEPSGPAFERLVKNRPKSAGNLRAGLGRDNRKSVFTLALKDGYGGGCVRWHPRFRSEVAAEGYAFEDREIAIRTYRTVVESFGASYVDMFVLDVDGYELEVIEGMAGSKFLPDVMCVEYPLVGIDNLKAKLSALGYRYEFASFNNAFFARPDIPVPPRWGETGLTDY